MLILMLLIAGAFGLTARAQTAPPLQSQPESEPEAEDPEEDAYDTYDAITEPGGPEPVPQVPAATAHAAQPAPRVSPPPPPRAARPARVRAPQALIVTPGSVAAAQPAVAPSAPSAPGVALPGSAAPLHPTSSAMLRAEGVTLRQAEYLQQRFDLAGKTHPKLKMSGGRKPIPVGPTARLPAGLSWDQLSQMSPQEIRQRKAFPFPPLWHPLQEVGGMVFPPAQTGLVQGLERTDVLFDLPDSYLPEFPPPLFLTSRPDLGDVSQGQLITLKNVDALFQEILTPTQLDGLKLMLEKTAAQRHNPSDDRSTEHPVAGVACFDCHVNGHSTAQFSLSPDVRPQSERFRVDTVSLRGVFVQSWFGSKRAIRSLEAFAPTEDGSAYFDGDAEAALRKGARELSEADAIAMAQFERLIDFPPAPKLGAGGRLERGKVSPSELRGEKVFNQHCASCHPGPWFTDNLAHDLKVERFYDHTGSTRLGSPGRAEGPFKTYSLRGIKDSPPYLHDGRLLTLEDAVEFFNIVLQAKLNRQQRADLVNYLRAL